LPLLKKMLRQSNNTNASLFRISLIIKTIQGTAELLLGFAFLYIQSSTVTLFLQEFTRDELVENPYDKTSHFLLQTGNSIVASGTLFIALYLLSHGIIKLLLIIGILKKKLEAYYIFITILTLFIIYQLYRYSITHSVLVLIFTIFDILFCWLVWKESKILKA
jgi:uncharacterized membrane protein